MMGLARAKAVEVAKKFSAYQEAVILESYGMAPTNGSGAFDHCK